MDEIFSRIKIVPIDKCLIHEGTVPDWVDQIADTIKKDGILKNPIIVTQHQGHYVVLDGMHRFAAVRQLGLADILVFEVDYFSKAVVLEPPWKKEEVLASALTKKILPPKSTKHVINGRPLRVDIDLSLLKEGGDLEKKNQKLQAHLRKFLNTHQLRFYPESVYVFAD